jgi:hypothetical protein
MTRLTLLLLMACGTTTVDFTKDCDVRLGSVSPAEGPAGATIGATLKPATTHWDTAVYVGDKRALVTEIIREGCEACDTCKEDAGCLSCSDCDECDATCEANCVETVIFTIPDQATGITNVVAYNGHGGSNAQPFQVTNQSDTGSTDSGLGVDSGTSESTDTGATSVDDTGER